MSLTNEDQALYRTFASEIADHLRTTRTPDLGSLAVVHRRGHEFISARLNIPGEPVECKHGCAWCCCADFEVTVPEVVAAVAAADALDAGVREHVWSRGHQHRTNGNPCPLLDGTGGKGTCRVYPVRPLVCALHWARPGARCRESLGLEGRGEPGLTFVPLGPLRGLRWAYGTAIKEAYGRPFELLSLRAALAVALSDRDALARWCEGEDVFERANVDKAVGIIIPARGPQAEKRWRDQVEEETRRVEMELLRERHADTPADLGPVNGSLRA